MSAFGGVVCLNRAVDRELAEALPEQFIEVLFAPRLRRGCARGARRKSRTCGSSTTASARAANLIEPHLRQVVGGMLVQDRDVDLEERGEMQVVTERRPTEAEWQELLFAWRVCKHVKLQRDRALAATAPRSGSAPGR